MANNYTSDGKFIIDASGKQWPVDVAHLMPLPNGLQFHTIAGGGYSLLFAGPDGEWSCEQYDTDTHWLARAPLPPVPKPKTQAELDEEAYHAYMLPIVNKAHGIPYQSVWNAALAYERNRTAATPQ